MTPFESGRAQQLAPGAAGAEPEPKFDELDPTLIATLTAADAVSPANQPPDPQFGRQTEPARAAVPVPSPSPEVVDDLANLGRGIEDGVTVELPEAPMDTKDINVSKILGEVGAKVGDKQGLLLDNTKKPFNGMSAAEYAEWYINDHAAESGVLDRNADELEELAAKYEESFARSLGILVNKLDVALSGAESQQAVTAVASGIAAAVLREAARLKRTAEQPEVPEPATVEAVGAVESTEDLRRRRTEIMNSFSLPDDTSVENLRAKMQETVTQAESGMMKLVASGQMTEADVENQMDVMDNKYASIVEEVLSIDARLAQEVTTEVAPVLTGEPEVDAIPSELQATVKYRGPVPFTPADAEGIKRNERGIAVGFSNQPGEVEDVPELTPEEQIADSREQLQFTVDQMSQEVDKLMAAEVEWSSKFNTWADRVKRFFGQEPKEVQSVRDRLQTVQSELELAKRELQDVMKQEALLNESKAPAEYHPEELLAQRDVILETVFNFDPIKDATFLSAPRIDEAALQQRIVQMVADFEKSSLGRIMVGPEQYRTSQLVIEARKNLLVQQFKEELQEQADHIRALEQEADRATRHPAQPVETEGEPRSRSAAAQRAISSAQTPKSIKISGGGLN